MSALTVCSVVYSSTALQLCILYSIQPSAAHPSACVLRDIGSCACAQVLERLVAITVLVTADAKHSAGSKMLDELF